ncbi:MAG: 3-deoxy-manno-octulosonate cytidylyltransferase [Proteobacteria bacterium]|nr:3-deoxy-manno-octulosonate cytidylyltransferase [Pseudomonadota bacterium]
MSQPQAAPLILIPARLAAERLPGKPLADIGGAPMIVRVLRQAEAAGAGPVAVAAGDQAIVDVVEAVGGRAVLTDPALPSGTDRVRAAADLLDPDRAHDTVINLQGDMPFVHPQVVSLCAGVLRDRPECDIATVVAHEGSPDERTDPAVVKAVLTEEGRALYFTRSTLYGEGPIWHHLGVYGYRRSALDRFVAAPPSPLERRERLEQLRALEMGMTIWAAITDRAPVSVDTPADLERARAQAG